MIENPSVESFEVSLPSAIDPWQHRRGEPRVFAFLWTLYMLASVLGSLLWITRTSVLAGSAYGPAARIMLLMIAIGATVLWPMARLSQLLPSGNVVKATLADLVIVALPIQVIVWPLVFLAAWPFQAVFGIAVLMFVWPALMGGLIALAQVMIRRAGPESVFALIAPAFFMALSVAGVLAGPVMIGVQRVQSVDPTRATVWLFSPLTHIFRLAGIGLSTPRPTISSADWSMLGAVGGVAGGLWFLAACLAHTGQKD
ncbi:MAG: hypothetical protein H7210_04980 [Pyrinomonadaceae bacterium]|nr:hypothetical protein [Phycisphaerales bacterium]